MKTKIVLGLTGIAALISASSYAGDMGAVEVNYVRGGWIIGGDVGYGYLSTPEVDILAPVPFSIPLGTEIQAQNHRLGNAVGGGYLGYNFPVSERLLLGLEGGYKYLGNSRYRSFALDNTFGNFLDNTIKVKQQAVDFLLTGRFYVSPRVNLIAKAGGAYVNTETKQFNRFFIADSTGNLYTNPQFWRIRPEFAFGAGCSVTNNLDVNFMYTHIGGADANVNGFNRFFNAGPDRTPAVFEYNGITGGISYTFG